MRSRLGFPSRLVHRRFLGHDLVVREGAIREQPDYDDAWLLACALRAETIFDVGANLGQAALIELSSRSVKVVILIEANPEALSIAAENLIRNGFATKARFVCAFAGDTDDARKRLWTVGTGAAGSMYAGHARSAAKARRSLDVPTITIDHLCDAYATVPDLIKVDVEGAENEVLRGSRRCARYAKTRFLVEMHSPPELPMVENAARVLAWCEEVGLAAWYLAEGGSLKRPEQLGRRGRCHLLLQPTAWPYPDWLKGIGQSASPESVQAFPEPCGGEQGRRSQMPGKTD